MEESKTEIEEITNCDYTADGVYTIKKQLELIEEEDKKNPIIITPEIEFRELLQRVKMLALNKMGFDVFTDTRFLSKFARETLKTEMHKYDGKNPDEIIQEFNEVLCTVLDEHKSIEKLPVYKHTYAI